MVVNFRARGISRGAQAGPDTHVNLKKKKENLVIFFGNVICDKTKLHMVYLV